MFAVVPCQVQYGRAPALCWRARTYKHIYIYVYIICIHTSTLVDPFGYTDKIGILRCRLLLQGIQRALCSRINFLHGNQAKTYVFYAQFQGLSDAMIAFKLSNPLKKAPSALQVSVFLIGVTSA